ncbi:MAG: T9SS type A sorting domain-containing protein [Phaeodactylibacter sp.]|nr:T9SS type A sorting domain-containing protein [Phaeodactylibacter sp.]
MNVRRPLFLFLLAVLGLSTASHAQVRNCGAMEYLEQQIQDNPARALRLQAIDRHAEHVQQNAQRAVTGTIVIPTVVHIVYRTSAENISDAQVQSQIDVLNEDFRRLNADAANTPSVFQGVAADAEIQFCLASVDPSGNATTGITRTVTTRTSFGTNDLVKSSSTGGKDAWPAGDYLNIWVCNIGGGILGYAQFPGGPAATDGVVNDYRYTGRYGTAQAPFNLGRTATHEVGHWLNLRHIWGDGNCNADDFVSDTPTAGGANYTGSPCTFPGPNSCNDGAGDLPDMFQNYMDYSDDGCMNLYTQGQKTRMRALFEPGGFRASLLNSNGCGQGTTPTCSDGIQNGDETGVDCGGSVCDACPCNANTLTLTITLDNYPEETSWNVRDAGNNVVASGGTYGSQPDGSTIVENINLTDGNYTFTISDAYGDGICCSYGNGSYSLTDGTNTIASGGAFGSSESTQFCTSGGGGGPTCSDGVQNGDETGVDCGGPDCPACPTCSDGVQNGDETGVDCGGPDCPACVTCTDGVQNGDETGVDCGGSCPPCSGGCQDNGVTLTVTLDNYPEETSWEIRDAGNNVVASGGTYGSQPDGATVIENACLTDGCYDFIIYDAYGDGICCSYGNGSYALTSDANGSTLASGGSFGSSETTNFCFGGGPTPTCSDGVQNGDETGVDCGGSCPACPTCSDGVLNGNETDVDCGGPDCPACPTCSDGIQNGDETGVDCGGSCAPCGGGGCTYVSINANNFEGGWGIWNDGGSDCARVNNSTYANSGSYSIRLRDNTNSSTMTTDNLNLASYDELTVDFSYYAVSMENNEDFWLQASTNGGSSYVTLATWARGADFNNNQRYNESVVITGTFTSNMRFRFRCDASGNSDWVYIDDVVITGCLNGARQAGAPAVVGTQENTEDAQQRENADPTTPSYMKLFPNPVREELTVTFQQQQAGPVQLTVSSLAGQQVYRQAFTADAGRQEAMIDVSQMAPGVYVIHLLTDGQALTKRFVVAR